MLLALWDRAEFYREIEGKFRNTQKMGNMHSWLWERPAAIKTSSSLQWIQHPFVPSYLWTSNYGKNDTAEGSQLGLRNAWRSAVNWLINADSPSVLQMSVFFIRHNFSSVTLVHFCMSTCLIVGMFYYFLCEGRLG